MDNLCNFGFNDCVCLIWVYGCGFWWVCQYCDYGGVCMQVFDDMFYIGGGMVGEILLAEFDYNFNCCGICLCQGIWLFDGYDFDGCCFDVSYDIFNLDGEGFNDCVDSLVVVCGEIWEVCEYVYYCGCCEIVDSESILDLSCYGFQNRIFLMWCLDGY